MSVANRRTLMRSLVRPVLVFLAFVFLIEAGLWHGLARFGEQFVAFIRFVRLKAMLGGWIAGWPPAATLVLLALPAGVVLPLKMLAFWLMATGAWIEGVVVFAFAKLGAIGTTAFVFEAGGGKLLQLPWFYAVF